MNWGSFWIGVAVGVVSVIIITILIGAIVSISVLSYFAGGRIGSGIRNADDYEDFNPSSLVADSLVINPPFNADSFTLNNNGGANGNDAITIELTSNQGNSIVIKEMKIDGKVDHAGSECKYIPSDTSGIIEIDQGGTVMLSGQQYVVTFDCADENQFSSGEQFVGDIKIVYNVAGSTLERTATGSLRGSVI